MSNLHLSNYLVDEFNTFKKYKNEDFCKIINRGYHFIIITLLKHYLVCTFFDNQIDVRKCERKFGSLRILIVR